MTLLLSRSDVADLLPIEACIEAVEGAFRLHGEGLEDVAAAAAVYERAVRAGRGVKIDLGA